MPRPFFARSSSPLSATFLTRACPRSTTQEAIKRFYCSRWCWNIILGLPGSAAIFLYLTTLSAGYVGSTCQASDNNGEGNCDYPGQTFLIVYPDAVSWHGLAIVGLVGHILFLPKIVMTHQVSEGLKSEAVEKQVMNRA